MIDIEDTRGPGRIRTPARRPSARRRAKTEAYNRALEEFTDAEAIMQAVHGESVESLYAAREAIAREAAALLFERKNAVPGSREAARTSSRRIAALTEVGSLTVAIHKTDPGQPSPERLERILGLLRFDIEEVLKDLFDEPTAQRLLDELARRLPDLRSLQDRSGTL